MQAATESGATDLLQDGRASIGRASGTT